LTMTTNALLALFWVFAAHRMREFIQTPLEEKWITGWYNSDKLLHSVAQKLIPAVEKEEVFKIIAEELKSAIKIKDIEIIVGKLEEEYHDVIQTKKGLVIPLSSSDKIEGALILGPKISEDPYTEKDLTVFRTIMIQARAIFDRIRPYEKIKADLEKTERELERSQRLAAIGTLMAGVTHEIRNPLTIIRSRMEGLFDQTRDENYLKMVQRVVIESVDRIDAIIRGMLGIARQKKERKELAIDLNQVIKEALGFFVISGIKVVKKFSPLFLIKGDPDELREVFVNLFQNAIQAMPNGGTLTIESYSDKENVCVEISDTGCGIPKENLERIFDPFFSTHHEGVGLGLSIVYRIVREHGGKIEVKSEVNKGTTFKVYFPLVV
ncbi:MAG: two-component system sensor histidine kinase NtrB, partial [Candidatus Margulisiibacteriota bacterium]